MFQPLGKLFSNPLVKPLEQDLKYIVQSFLQKELGTDRVVCQGIQRGAAHVRVGTPALYEQVKLLEYDVRKFLHAQAEYQLKSIRVVIG